MKTKMEQRIHFRAAYEIFSTKREREAKKRWNRFLLDRAEFDEELAKRLDTYEFMMEALEGRE
jgi:hypothetical protein